MEVQDPSNDDVASVRIGDTLRAGTAGSDFDNLVTASTWSMVLDRATGQVALPAQVSSQMAMPATEVPVDGPWLKLPSDVQQQDYNVFDPQLRGSAPAQFAGEEEIGGRTVYTFTQHIEPTNLALRYADALNASTAEVGEGEDADSVRTFRNYAADREIQVDQVTGLVVGMREKVDTSTPTTTASTPPTSLPTTPRCRRRIPRRWWPSSPAWCRNPYRKRLRGVPSRSARLSPCLAWSARSVPAAPASRVSRGCRVSNLWW
mgnify:CR=1 FL=1